MKIKILFILIVSLMVQPLYSSVVFAIEDQHIISQTIINAPDVTPPTAPTDLDATAVSTSQIDLTWGASTDTFAIIGYRVYRDSVFIATSSELYYSDTGLSPETLYTYTVTGVDLSYNESLHSASSSATTFSVTPPAPPPSSGQSGSSGGSLVLELRNLVVVPGTESAFIEFDATLPVQAVVSWGETPDYEIGSLSRPVYQDHHQFLLESLTPSTLYYFRIELTDGYGRKRVLEYQTFLTLAEPVAPMNVFDFQATPSGTNILLTWINPPTNFDEVRIVRSDIFFPADPENGEIIYEGRSDSYVDSDVEIGKTYYYAAFVKDEKGDFSSGSLASAKLIAPGEIAQSIDIFKDIAELPTSLVHPLLRDLSLLDIEFYQDGRKLDITDGTVTIKGDRNLSLAIAYDKLPEVLKTIVVTLRDPKDSDKTFSFLLRINEEKTAYEATIAPLKREGTYSFVISILDHKHQGLRKIGGVIEAVLPDLVFKRGSNFFDNFVSSEKSYLWLSVFVLLLIISFLLIFKKKRIGKHVESHVPIE